MAEESHGYCKGREAKSNLRKRPAVAGLFFNFSDGSGSMTRCDLLYSLYDWQGIGKYVAVANRLGDYFRLWSFSRTGSIGGIGREATPQIFLEYSRKVNTEGGRNEKDI